MECRLSNSPHPRSLAATRHQRGQGLRQTVSYLGPNEELDCVNQMLEESETLRDILSPTHLTTGTSIQLVNGHCLLVGCFYIQVRETWDRTATTEPSPLLTQDGGLASWEKKKMPHVSSNKSRTFAI